MPSWVLPGGVHTMCQLGVARGCTYHVPKLYFLFLSGDGRGGSMEEFFSLYILCS